MKKLFFGFFFTFIITFRILASEYINGHHYITFLKIATKKPQVIEFFSFYCSHCYAFERIYFINDTIRKNLPKDVPILKYHVNFLGGPMGKILTHAWSVAIVLGIENKVQSTIFKSIQTTRIINSSENLKKIFSNIFNINPKEYEQAWNSILTKDLLLQQEKLIFEIGLKSVPNILINGKYMVNVENISSNSIDGFIDDYIQLLKYLVQKK